MLEPRKGGEAKREIAVVAICQRAFEKALSLRRQPLLRPLLIGSQPGPARVCHATQTLETLRGIRTFESLCLCYPMPSGPPPCVQKYTFEG